MGTVRNGGHGAFSGKKTISDRLTKFCITQSLRNFARQPNAQSMRLAYASSLATDNSQLATKLTAPNIIYFFY